LFSPRLLLAASLSLVPFTTIASAQQYSGAGFNDVARSGDTQSLLRYTQAWTKASPNDPNAWAYLGQVYGLRLHQPEQAIQAMKRSLEIDPNQAPGWHALGVTYMDLKQYREASTAIEKAIHLNPNQPHYYNSLAAAYSGMGHWDSAQIALDDEQPSAAQARDPALYFALGNGYLRLAILSKAIPAYRACLRLKPDFAKAWTNLGSALEAGNDINGALAAYAKGSAYGDPLAAQNAAALKTSVANRRAQAATRGSSPCSGMMAASCVIGQSNKAGLENQLHQSGALNINEHLP
jgi:tetratricopeptide (TPR) repeat protein